MKKQTYEVEIKRSIFFANSSPEAIITYYYYYYYYYYYSRYDVIRFSFKIIFIIVSGFMKTPSKKSRHAQAPFVTSSDDKNGKEQEKENKSVDEKAILTFIFSFIDDVKIKMNVSITFSFTLLSSFSCSFPFLPSLEVILRSFIVVRIQVFQCSKYRSFSLSRNKKINRNPFSR